jgi:hypothetical protein
MCSDTDTHRGNAKNIYGISGKYVGGTVHVKTTIPKDMLKYIKPIYKEGDVIDCGGYRGLDLYIFENNEFNKVMTEGYYPIWGLDRCKKYGYRNLLRGLMWGEQAEFDLIELEHGINITPNGFCYRGKIIKIKSNHVEESYETNSKDKNLTKTKYGEFYKIDNPIKNADEFISYLNMGISLQIKVSDFDYLVVNQEKPDYIYFVDLNMDNRIDLSMC